MKATIVSAGLAVLVLSVVTPPVIAQDTIAVSGEVTCRDCRITLDTVATIGGPDGLGAGVIGPQSVVAIDRRGRIFVSTVPYSDISVFDMSGRFIRTIGGRGEGPGEYFWISDINAGQQYIHVFEYHDGRTLLDYEFNVVRTDRFPGQVSRTFVMESDNVVFSARVSTRAAAGYRFHLLDTLGAIYPFGDGSRVSTGSGDVPEYLFQVTADNESVWFVAIRGNQLVRWQVEPEPTLVQVFERTVAEFDRHLERSSWPRASNFGAMLDAQGLWIVWNTPDPDMPELEEGAAIPQESRDEYYDGWIDLVDPSTGLTLARYQGGEYLKGFARGSRYVVAYEETEGGVPYIHLLAPNLLRD